MSWMIIGYKWDQEEPIMKWSAKTNREVIGLMKTAVDNLQLDHIDVLKSITKQPKCKLCGNEHVETDSTVKQSKGCGKITGWNKKKDCNFCIGDNLCPACKEKK